MSRFRRTAAARTTVSVALGALLAGAGAWSASPSGAAPSAAPSGAAPSVASAAAKPGGPPAVQVSTLMTGLAIPWDLTFTPDGTMLVTERAGRTLARLPDGTIRTVTTAQQDLFVGSESGLMGIVVDPAFATNRQYYTCQAYRGTGTSPIDIRVIRWSLASGATSATRVGNPVISGLPISTGRHGGCRLRFDTTGHLHVGTGDAAVGTNPQNLDSLGGKTLRLNTDGTAPSDNPFFSRGGRAAYVWTYGHRNVQGLALRPGTSQMWNVEHGSTRDDEVNVLSAGANYGWDPVPGYDESVPMTDLTKFPSAIPARWSSGDPTVATSGASFLTGSGWGLWEGALAVAELKNAGVRILMLTEDGRVRAQAQLAALDDSYGRIRTVQTGPGGAIYVTTSNGSNDRVLRVSPTTTPQPYSPGLDVSPSGVSAVVQGTAVTVFVRGTAGHIHYSRQSVPGGPWTPFTTIPGVVASAPSATTWDGNRIDLVARGSNGHLMHTWSTGAGWQPWRDVGGTLTSAPTAAATSVGTVDVVARGPGDALMHRRLVNGTWGSWRSAGGIITSAASLRADRATGRVTATARGRDGYVHDIVLDSTGVVRAWQKMQRHTWSAPAVGAGTAPLLVTRNGQIPVLVTGSSGQALGGDLTGAPAVAQRPDGSWLITGRSLDNALWVYDGRPGKQTWSKVGGILT
ncbi:PQQ-dependent sugar dehydrogenase [Pedococcus bigeumensis]|uniref:PQQ-dependent sugar dehydrogenase n=1 Tax=Pedococcus bigeumensis TaxID=433644 RepID=A0A502D452_9MICO|nr:PQQ-dependent sugar dehydrogenase [Pedococcus bigeumensis]TPG19169.1 PQQ-dependent sugar dehydrogenase [Pedococcus bigeumensis]